MASRKRRVGQIADPAIREALNRWVLSDDNTPEEEEAWRALYGLLFPRPPGSHDVTAENGMDEPVMMP